MATLKFMKIANRVMLSEVYPIGEHIKDFKGLKDEVKFLKGILHMKRFGGGFSELAHTVKTLQKENHELRRRIIPQERINLVLQQNSSLKKQLIYMQSAISRKYSDTSGSHIEKTLQERSELSRKNFDMNDQKDYSDESVISNESRNIEKDISTQLSPVLSEGQMRKNLIIDVNSSMKKSEIRSPINLQPRRRATRETLSEKDDDDEEEKVTVKNFSKFKIHVKDVQKYNRSGALSSSSNLEPPSIENARALSPDDLSYLMDPRLCKTYAVSPNRVYQSRDSSSGRKGSPTNNKEFQSIINLIEDHVAKRSDMIKIKSPSFYRNYPGTISEVQPVPFHFANTAKSGEIRRHPTLPSNIELIKKIKKITSKGSGLPISLTPFKNSLKTERKYRGSEMIEKKSDQSPPPTGKLLMRGSVGANGIHMTINNTGKRFFIGKYDRSLQSIKRQLESLNFD